MRERLDGNSVDTSEEPEIFYIRKEPSRNGLAVV
jgi:hypothetical protein